MFVVRTAVYGSVDKEPHGIEGEIGAKLAGMQLLDCSRIFYRIFHHKYYSRSVHPRTETDMAAFEAPL